MKTFVPDQRAIRRTGRSVIRLGLASTMLTGMAALLPVAAHAQAAPDSPPEAPQPSTGTGIGEIVVTATHKAESLQKVPISIQALDSAKLEQSHVQNFADYAALVPSLSFETLGPGRSEPYFRGISVSGGQASTVGTYLDDIPITSTGMNPEVHVYDMERVEALSGPQGTLFGASSLAGTIRLITNKPKFDKLEAGVDIEANKWGKGAAGGTIEGFINIPIASNLAVRIMAYDMKTGGYINNTPGTVAYESLPLVLNNSSIAKNNYNPDYEYGGRAAVSWEIAPDWTITPEVTYQYMNSQGGYNFDPRVGDLDVHDYSPTFMIDHWYQAELAIQGKIGDFDVFSATGLFSRTYSQANDYTYYSITYDRHVADGSLGNYYNHFYNKQGDLINPTQRYYGHEHDKKFTQEVRLSVPKSWPFQLQIGGFYQYQRESIDGNYYIPGLSTAISTLGFSPALPGAYSPDSYYLVEEDSHSKDGAAFAEGNYNITSKLKLNAGIRYFVSDNGTYGFDGTWSSAVNAHQAGSTASCWNSDPTVLYDKFIHPSRLSCINNDEQYHQTGQTHKVSLSYQVEPSKMIYATYSTGFRPGGGNRLSGSQPYKADTLDNFEVGWKTTWGRNFHWNGAVYYEKWDGIQYVVIPPAEEGAGVIVNAGNARVYGIETDIEWKPFAGLTLSSNGAYNNAALSTNFCDLVGNGNLAVRSTCSANDASAGNEDTIAAAKGTRLPRQPRFKGSTTARYDIERPNGSAFVQAQAFYQTGSTSDLDVSNDALLGDTSAFVTFNFSVGETFGKTSVEAFIENAFDNRGILSKNTFCSIQECAGSSRSYPTKPQFFGLRVGYKY
jgi:iron complex outermembrane recepter protein